MDIDKLAYYMYKQLIEDQYIERDINKLIPSVALMTRADLRSIPKLPNNIVKGKSRSSGSTGEPLILEKTWTQYITYLATNLIELDWRKWDLSKNIAVISPRVHEVIEVDTIVNPYFFKGKPGKTYMHPVQGDLQGWIDSIPCEYLSCLPSIVKTLNTSKFIDIKSTSERNGTMYSASEVGTIGIECPDNPSVYHVMSNIVLEIDDDSNILVTDLCHPYIKRYMIGDKGEFGTCDCGRKSQVLKKDVLGRVRNMALGQFGDRYWPLFGTLAYCDLPNIKRFQAVQVTQKDIIFKVQGDLEVEDISKIIKILNETLGSYYNYTVEIVDSFPSGKHEEFICLV